MTAVNPRQIKLWRRLQDEAGVTAKGLVELWEVADSTVYRIFSGILVPDWPAMELLCKTNRAALGIVLRHLAAGSDFGIYEQSDDAIRFSEIGPGLFKAIHETASIAEARQQHLADGKFEQHEKEEQLASLDKLIADLKAVRSGVANQPAVERKKAKTLRINDGGAA